MTKAIQNAKPQRINARRRRNKSDHTTASVSKKDDDPHVLAAASPPISISAKDLKRNRKPSSDQAELASRSSQDKKKLRVPTILDACLDPVVPAQAPVVVSEQPKQSKRIKLDRSKLAT